ncbi:MAG: hypothetical protein WCJ18_05375, partial [Planctomycetota bacterium]
MELKKVLSAVALAGAILSAGSSGGERGHAADAGAVIDATDPGDAHYAALMQAYNELSGENNLLKTIPADKPTALAFNPEGALFALLDGKVHRIDLDSGTAAGRRAQRPPLRPGDRR